MANRRGQESSPLAPVSKLMEGNGREVLERNRKFENAKSRRRWRDSELPFGRFQNSECRAILIDATTVTANPLK